MVGENLSALPPYRRIAAQIRARIDSGELLPGDRIPSVRALTRTEGVSTATATRVAAVLRAEGYAESVPGIGTVVTVPRTLTPGPERWQLLRAGGSGVRDGERTEILGTGRVAAPPDVADALGLDEGSTVVRRVRRYLDSQGVVVVSTSWLPGELGDAAPELLAPEPLPRMTFGAVEDATGRRAVRRRDTVAIRAVPDDLAETLDAEPQTPTLVMTNHYWDQNGEITEYAVDYLRPGRQLSAEHDFTETKHKR